ncbi:MAG: BlaI/MecI/CopY family transcriptional regulator [Phycisphaerales bacterium]|nr:BlaI/MecI/CopY family transcriptional regulator [Phycisphaerales bacterium]
MRRSLVPDLGPLEHHLLRIVWRMNPVSARDVLDAHNHSADKVLAYTTVMTLLTRMVEKGALTVDRSRQPFLFTAAISREQMLAQRVRDFVDQFFDGQSTELALKLVEESPISAESLQRLEEILKQHRRTSLPASANSPTASIASLPSSETSSAMDQEERS